MDLQKLYDHPEMERLKATLELLFANKPKKKNLLKVCEELSELITAILQYINKGGTLEDIEEEFVDVFIQMNLLAMFMSEQILSPILKNKCNKMYTLQRKYLNL